MDKRAVWRLVFIAAALFLFFFELSRIPLWSPDEGRFGEIVREMWTARDFVVPHFNHIEILEKPVFAFWLGALSCAAFGVSALSVRLPSVLSALLGLFFTYHFTRRLIGEKAARLAAAVLMTSLGYMLVGRYAVIDMVMTMLMSAALFCLASAAIERRPNCYLAAYVFMGLAFITKGLIGLVLPALIFLAFLAWTRDWGEIRRMRLGWGALIVLLISLPWGIAISMQEPEFSYTFIMEQHFTRFSSAHFGRRRPFWFFAPILLAFSFPWSFFLPAAAVQRKGGGKREKALAFCLLWLSVVFVFFSIPRSKLPYYILPACVPLAVLVGAWLETHLETAAFRRILMTAAAVFFSALAGLYLYLFLWNRDARLTGSAGLLHGIALSAAAGAVFTALAFRKGPERGLWALVGTLYVLFLLVILGMKAVTPYLSTDGISRTLDKMLKDGDEVAMLSSPDRFADFPFHLRRRVIVVGSDRGTIAEELDEPEHAGEIGHWFPSSAEFVERFKARRYRIFCLMDEGRLPELEHIGLGPYRRVQDEGGKVLISNEA